MAVDKGSASTTKIVETTADLYNEKPEGFDSRLRGRREEVSARVEPQGFPEQGFTVIESNLRPKALTAADFPNQGAGRKWRPKGRAS